MGPDITVFGYHGTSFKAAQAILEAGEHGAEQFLASENDTDWLGDGIYFFQDAPYRAREWPEIRWPTWRRIKNPVVLCAEIELTHCLDLLDIQAGKSIANWYPRMEATYAVGHRPLPQNREGRRYFDRALINYVVGRMDDVGGQINSIRAAFVEGKPIVPGSHLYSHTHTFRSLCVLSVPR